RLASLLPPVGTEVFRHFTATSAEGSKRHPDTEDERDQSNQPQRANDLEAGKPLPFFYGDPPSEFLNTPLEELDPFYQSQKTFLVLGKGKTIHRFDSSPSCFLFSPFNPLRKCAIRVLIHPYPLRCHTLLSCVFMTMKNPPVWISSLGITAVYTVEVIVKVMSRGILIGRFSFLRDPWNWLDILVIIFGYVPLFVDLGKVSVLSSALQVLKLLPLIPGQCVCVCVCACVFVCVCVCVCVCLCVCAC
uniref:Sodium channel protein type 3 subunit alpha-like n=1 Tax=Labrus bergylta TaxID=56723 RepID=A0A3Q3M465_9LABR